MNILDTLIAGGAQKGVALQVGRSASTISGTLRRSLSRLGFHCTGSKLPMFAVMAACAARKADVPGGRAALIDVQQRRYQVVIAPRPDREFPVALSPAEASVVRLLVEGLNYAEIAVARGSSQRTVANQLAASFRKLGISGRLELLGRLVASTRAACGNDAWHLLPVNSHLLILAEQVQHLITNPLLRGTAVS